MSKRKHTFALAKEEEDQCSERTPESRGKEKEEWRKLKAEIIRELSFIILMIAHDLFTFQYLYCLVNCNTLG